MLLFAIFGMVKWPFQRFVGDLQIGAGSFSFCTIFQTQTLKLRFCFKKNACHPDFSPTAMHIHMNDSSLHSHHDSVFFPWKAGSNWPRARMFRKFSNATSRHFIETIENPAAMIGRGVGWVGHLWWGRSSFWRPEGWPNLLVTVALQRHSGRLPTGRQGVARALGEGEAK